MNIEKIFIENNGVATFYIGDMCNYLHNYQGFFRNLKFNIKPDYTMIMMANIKLFPFVNDFVDYFIDLPEEFKEIGKYQCGYESVSDKDSQFTDPEAYASLINYFRTFYDKGKVSEGFAPRGMTGTKIAGEQLFCSQYLSFNSLFKRKLSKIFSYFFIFIKLILYPTYQLNL
jgi:hypothetical protein